MKHAQSKLLTEVYARYHLNEPLPIDAKKAMLDSKKKVLLAIYQKNKQYSFFLWIVLTIFFGVKRLGITLTITKSALVAVTVSLLCSMAVLTGSYYTITSLIQNQKAVPPVEEEAMQQATPATDIPTDTEKNATQKAVPAYTLGVVPFEYEAISPDLARQITEKIVVAINKSKGPRTAGMVSRAQQKQGAAKLLMGSITKIDRTIMITAKIMDPRTLKVTAYVTEEAAPGSPLDQVCNRIAARLVKEI